MNVNVNALPCCIKHAKVPKKVRYVTITVDGNLKLQANTNVLLSLDDDFMGRSVQCRAPVCNVWYIQYYGMYVCISVFLFSIQLSISNVIINGRCKYFVLNLITCTGTCSSD